MLWSPRMAFLLVLLAAAGLVVYHKIHMAVPNLDAYPPSPLITRPTSSLSSAAGTLTANSSYDYANSITGSSLKSVLKMERIHAKRPLNRRLLSDTCTEKDIDIHQGPEGTISGVSQYIVQIVNTCLSDSGYAPSDVHVFCGWFASNSLVKPDVFRRIAYDDCLVNDGKPLRHGEIVRFNYVNPFMYPLRLKSAKFC